MLKSARQRGLSIVEPMVGVVVGRLVLGGALSLFARNVSGSRQLLLEARLNQDLRAAMDLVTRDLRCAGYRGNAILGTLAVGASASAPQNPYAAVDTATSTITNDRFAITPTLTTLPLAYLCPKTCSAGTPNCGTVSVRSIALLVQGTSVRDNSVVRTLRSTAALYVSRGVMFEQRISANQMQATLAQQVAEAAIEWVTGMLDSPHDIDTDCAFLTTTSWTTRTSPSPPGTVARR